MAEQCNYCGKRPIFAKGLCQACYMRKRRTGYLEYKRDRPRKYSKEVISILKKRYPKFSKVALCMIRNPEYGVDLSDNAKKYLKEAEKYAHKEETPVGNSARDSQLQCSRS
jgi:hypothetical protein